MKPPANTDWIFEGFRDTLKARAEGVFHLFLQHERFSEQSELVSGADLHFCGCFCE